MKKNVAVIFGGVSVEHDISVITGVQVLNALDSDRYNIYPILITKEGKWLFSHTFFDIKIFADFNPRDSKMSEVFLKNNDKILYKKGRLKPKPVAALDCVIFATHGAKGENGALQGFIECVGLPYTSAGVLSSAICMDKIITKKLLKSDGFNVCEYLALDSSDLDKGMAHCIKKIKGILEFPVVVKPASLGSSIGITVCSDNKQLEQAIKLAAAFDKRILIEHAITNLTEINVSVIGGNGISETSVLEQPLSAGSFLSFNDKYMSNGKGSKNSMANIKRKIPAKIEKIKQDYIISSAKQIFANFDLKGVVRIDYLIDNDSDVVYINEINTLPGSLSFYLWKHSHLPFIKLLDKLIDIALKEEENNKRFRVDYNSNVLKNFKITGKTAK